MAQAPWPRYFVPLICFLLPSSSDTELWLDMWCIRRHLLGRLDFCCKLSWDLPSLLLSNVTLVLWALAFLTCFGMEPDGWALVMRNDLQNGQERHAKQMVSCNGFNVEPYILDILVNKFPAECFEENSDSFGHILFSRSLPSAVADGLGCSDSPGLGSAGPSPCGPRPKWWNSALFFWDVFLGMSVETCGNVWKPTEITEIMDLVGHNMSLSRKCPQLI